MAADGWALACALIWLVHPLNSEAVDYLTQRTESMVALCLLTTLYASIRAWNAKERPRWQAIAILANACGMATKESMAVAPLLVLLCDRAFAFSVAPGISGAFEVLRRSGGWLAVARGAPAADAICQPNGI